MCEDVLVGLLNPPAYCQYADGACDQEMPGQTSRHIFFAYPSTPSQIAQTVEAAASKLELHVPGTIALPWPRLATAGQVIFCEICKATRASSAVVADVTTLNFNLLFEIGFAMGLGIPIIPIRDTNFARDRREFESLGLLDTLGYEDFQNSDDLATRLEQALPAAAPQPAMSGRFHREAPLYLLKGPVTTDGDIQLQSSLKKSRIKFRTFDPTETPRLSLNEARRQVAGSVGVVAHLMDPEREGATVHNARVALVAGLAMAGEKVVLLLQHGDVKQPIDYRDVVVSYAHPGQVRQLLESPLNHVVDFLQTGSHQPASVATLGILRDLDIGDVAAENEIEGLRSYFIETGQFVQARQGHARLVIGRKGSGKTALFYEVRHAERRGRQTLILDLRPEGHQFTRLRDFVEARMTAGLREHTLVAFWTYLLLTELARAALDADEIAAQRDPVLRPAYERLRESYVRHDPGQTSDFAQRLLRHIDRVVKELERVPVEHLPDRMTELVYSGDVQELTKEVTSYLSMREKVWLLIDNLDKGWPIRGSTEADILIIRALLDATRKLQQSLEPRGLDFRCLVFLRSDIFEHLQRLTPDKGKDTPIILNWDDPAVFELMVLRRIETSTELAGDFRDLWTQVCAPLVHGEDSFAYILRRTLMRPRDVLRFIRAALDVAINRGHNRIDDDDLSTAEHSYSQDLLLETAFEIADTRPEYGDVVLGFEASGKRLTIEEATSHAIYGGVAESDAPTAIQVLISYGFLGVVPANSEEVLYSFAVRNDRRLFLPLERGDCLLAIHPAFRSALGVEADE
jgi:hypothetical protein